MPWLQRVCQASKPGHQQPQLSEHGTPTHRCAQTLPKAQHRSRTRGQAGQGGQGQGRTGHTPHGPPQQGQQSQTHCSTQVPSQGQLALTGPNRQQQEPRASRGPGEMHTQGEQLLGTETPGADASWVWHFQYLHGFQGHFPCCYCNRSWDYTPDSWMSPTVRQGQDDLVFREENDLPDLPKK